MSSRRLTSLLVSLVASLVGLPLLWHAGIRALSAQRALGLDDPGSGETILWAAVAVLGALLIGLSGFAVRWSSLGPIVVGTLHLVLSLAALLLPFDPRGQAVFSPVVWLLGRLTSLDAMLGDGGLLFTFHGIGLLIGAALVAVGAAARLRRPSGGGWAVLSSLAGIVALAVAAAAVHLGADNYLNALIRFRPDPVLALGLVLLALLFGALLLPSARSVIELWIVGGGLTLAGIVFAIPASARALPVDWLRAIGYLGLSGALLALGLTVVGLALGVALRPVAPQAPVGPVEPGGPAEVAPRAAV